MFNIKNLLGDVHILLNDAVLPLEINQAELFQLAKFALEELALTEIKSFIERREFILSKDTLNSLPRDCLKIYSILYNINKDKSVGRGVSFVDRVLLEKRFPNWRTDKKANKIYNYMVGSCDKSFEVYPPQKNDGNKILVDFLVNPSVHLNQDSLINLPETYRKYLSYAIASAYLMKDTGDEMNINMAKIYLSMSQKILLTFAPELKEPPQKEAPKE
jgi:hypothetical protein